MTHTRLMVSGSTGPDATAAGAPKVMILAREPQAGGGVVNFVAMLVQALQHDVAWDYQTIGRRSSERHGITTALRVLGDYVRFCAKVIMTRPDVIHLNPSLVPRALGRDLVFLLLAHLVRPGRAYVFVHGWDERFFERIRSSRLPAMLVGAVLRRAARVTVLATGFRNDLLGLGLPPARVSVGTTMFDGRDAAPAMPSVRGATPTILFLSRVTREKGVMEFLEALAALLRDGYRLAAIVAGDGPALEEARRRAGEPDLAGHVSFPGYLRGTEKAAAFRRADIFVLPSYHGEGCPVALLEAMSHGLPIVATRVGGIPDVMVDGVNGLLLADASPTTVAQALRRLIDDRDLRERIEARNRRDAWDKYEARIVGARVLDAYREVIAGRTRGQVES